MKLLSGEAQKIQIYPDELPTGHLYLHYGNETFFPPSFAMARGEERKKWLNEHDKRTKWVISKK